jgi:hypothetical protein
VKGAEEATQLLRVCDGGVVLNDHRRKRVSEVVGRISLAGADGDAVAENLPAGLPDPVGGLDRPTLFHPTKRFQQLGGRNGGNGHRPQPREDVLGEACERSLSMAGRHLGDMHGLMPFSGDMFKAALRGQTLLLAAVRFQRFQCLLAFILANIAWVQALGNQLPELVSLLSRQGQAGVGVGPKAQRFPAAVQAVVHPPAV